MAVEEEVPAALDGERIDRVVAMMTGASRSEVSKWLSEGLVARNDEVVAVRSTRVAEGDMVAVDVDLDAPPPSLEPEPGIEVSVVHVDDDLIVVDKPAGLVVHPGAGNDTGTLVQGLLARFPELRDVGDPLRPGIVHRLDKDTSGLLLVARTPAAHEALTAMMAAREVQRRYLTLVWGHPEAASGLIDAPIGRSAREPTKMAVSARGKEARTRYEVRQTFDEPVEVALLECRLETGRTHQIRVHLAAIGHPVVGDARYRGARAALAAPRMVLHAASLELRHPVHRDQELRFESPLPADLAAVIDGLR
ncbi:RluA family pseudouridine synthase [Rhabdothermincola salaria]|uniref:RluA family pseudouridine synthase n=1 Tax=Rhabdothermincola salaria TaxID=2903142 RepID=UPI001E594943|nr:RluA family pseudouridine synthase [Rhabdothermincola salaria]